MTFKQVVATTEGLIVVGGLLLTVTSPILPAKVWAVITAITYLAFKIPSFRDWLESLPKKGKEFIDGLKSKK